eukprot:c51517_g1_i1 orf=58-414(+)
MDDRVSLDLERLAVSSSSNSSSPASLEISAKIDRFSSHSEHVIPISPDEIQTKTSTESFTGATDTSRHAGLLPDIKESEWSDNDIAECRICQEEEEIASLETPCACSGSLKFAHRKCV